MFGDLDCHESILDVALLFSAAFETSTSRQPKMKTIFFSASERKCQFVVTHIIGPQENQTGFYQLGSQLGIAFQMAFTTFVICLGTDSKRFHSDDPTCIY